MHLDILDVSRMGKERKKRPLTSKFSLLPSSQEFSCSCCSKKCYFSFQKEKLFREFLWCPWSVTRIQEAAAVCPAPLAMGSEWTEWDPVENHMLSGK